MQLCTVNIVLSVVKELIPEAAKDFGIQQAYPGFEIRGMFVRSANFLHAPPS